MHYGNFGILSGLKFIDIGYAFLLLLTHL